MRQSSGSPAAAAPFSVLRCAACGDTLDDRSLRSTCARCGGLIAVEHRPPAQSGMELQALFDERARQAFRNGSAADRSGVWRFRELVMPTVGDDAVSRPEGNTPLLSHAAVARHAGVDAVTIKHEGYNPSGSFKDRGMTVAVTQAVRIGARAVACASTGNTSASLSSYAAQAGIPSFVFIPEGNVAAGKLAQTRAYGARTLQIRGDFDDCLRLAREASESLGIYLVNSVNPFRIEGQKTIIFELLQQLRWQAPDWIALPAGNLGNTSAFGKALLEAHSAGLIDRMPRLLSVQATGAAPFARSFAEHFASRVSVRAETRATAIRIGDPASWDRAVGAITATNGVVEAVSDEEIFAAKRVIDQSGIGCEPASAASIAGIRALTSRGQIRRDERVVAILTGHLLKDPGGIEPRDSAADSPLSTTQALDLLQDIVRQG